MKFSKGNVEIIKLDENNSFYRDIYKTNSAIVSFYLVRQCSAPEHEMVTAIDLPHRVGLKIKNIMTKYAIP